MSWPAKPKGAPKGGGASAHRSADASPDPLPDSIANTVFAFRFSDAAGKSFLLAKDAVLAADDSIEPLMEKLKVFVPKQLATITVSVRRAGGVPVACAAHTVLLRRRGVSMSAVTLSSAWAPSCRTASPRTPL